MAPLSTEEPSMEIIKIPMKDIRIVGEHRPLVKKKLSAIADSMPKSASKLR
jgi:hypothetical protein